MILIVDDNQANRKLAKVLFEGEGYQVLTAGTAEEAERLLERGSLPSVILLDLQLPGVDGLELARRLKANPDYADILIVAVTAYAMKGDEERALAICDAYVAKPIDTQTLPTRIRALLRGAREAKDPQQRPTILVVEDNPTTRKLFRVALQIAGYRVLEAGDGVSARALMTDSRVDLILQDLNLPDTDGITLVEELRRLPGGAHVPVVALSGFMQRLEEARIMGAGFNAFLVKPVEPGRLSQVVDGLLAARESPSELELSPFPARRTLLVADDDPIQLKLLRLQLTQAGFEVRTVGGGEALLREARANPPDAIVSDILMPGQDGFELCLELRNDPNLAGVPVVLVSSHYGEDLDQDLARSVGASGLLSRSMGFGDVTAGIRACLSGGDPPTPEIVDLALHHRDRIVRQLERQVVARAGFEQRCALQAAQLTVLGAATEALSRGTDLGETLQSVLGFCFDAAAISKGILYLREPGAGLSVGHVIGYTEGEALDSFFGHTAWLEQIAQSQAVVRLPSAIVPQAAAGEILERACVVQALLVPLVSQGKDLGVLFLGLPGSSVELPALVRFAETLGAQIGQAVGLARSFERVGQSEQRWRSLFENATSGFLVVDLEQGVAREANPYARRLFGRTRAQLVGRAMEELLPEAERARVAKALQELSAGGSPKQMELQLESPSGRADVLVSLSEVAWDEGPAALWVLSDVTEQRALQRQLLHSQKLEAIGQLAGGIAHDFNNMLMPIMGFAEMAHDTIEEGHPAHRYLNQIARAAERSATLTSQILAFARQQVLEPEVVDLGQVVESCAPMLRRLIGESVEIVVRQSGEALAEIDAGQFEQVVLNLTINARDAMPMGGLLTIDTSTVELAEDDPERPESVPPGRYAVLGAADTGLGMDEDTLKHLFEPFFTTKPEGKGTGLGLAVVHGIVTQSGGFLAVASEVDAGTTLRIYLPSVRQTDQPATPAVGAKRPRRGQGERILLVEDEELVRQLLTESLRDAGYEVFVARDGEEALELSANLDLELHVLLTDCVMPGIGGVDLARRLVALRPELAVVFTSGYPAQDVLKDSRGFPRAPLFVRKPVTPRALLPKIREALGAPES